MAISFYVEVWHHAQNAQNPDALTHPIGLLYNALDKDYLDIKTAIELRLTQIVRELEHPLFSFVKHLQYRYGFNGTDSVLVDVRGNIWCRERVSGADWTSTDAVVATDILDRLRKKNPIWDELCKCHAELLKYREEASGLLPVSG